MVRENGVRALITNDDGISSPGLVTLATAAHEAGLAVTVAAPNREFSGASAALTAVEHDGRILFEQCELPGLPGVPAYAVAASPAFIVLVAEEGGFGPPPDIVLSGINNGANMGRAVTHSGTVGAALTAAHTERRAAAFSIGAGIRATRQPQWDTAGAVVRDLLPFVYDLAGGVVLNVNVPDVEYPQLNGVRQAGLGRFGAVVFTIVESGEGFVRMGLTANEAELDNDTDEYWLHRGYVTVTPLRPAGEATDVVLPLGDLTRSGYPGQPT